MQIDSNNPHTKTRELNTRNQLFRIQAIHNIIQSARYPNCTTLAKHLEVSTRTIRRDVEFITDQLNMPVAYDSSLRGYYYTAQVDCLPTQSFNLREVHALEAVVQRIKSSPDYYVLSGLVDKIRSLGGIPA